MKYYIATSLANTIEHNFLQGLLYNHQITYDWTTHGAAWPHGLDRVAEVIRKEIEGVLDADAVIVILPGGRGTHVEMGAAIAAKKIVIIVGQQHHFECKEGLCGFYHHPDVIRFNTFTEVRVFLDAKDYLLNGTNQLRQDHNHQQSKVEPLNQGGDN